MVFEGRRKSMKILTLTKLNDKFNLGMSKVEIEGLSTAQLRRKIFEIKQKNGLVINKRSIYQQRISEKKDTRPILRKYKTKLKSYRKIWIKIDPSKTDRSVLY